MVIHTQTRLECQVRCETKNAPSEERNKLPENNFSLAPHELFAQTEKRLMMSRVELLKK